MSQQRGVNPVTKNKVIVTNGTLRSVSNKPNTNKNGKQYRVVTVELLNKHGKKETYTGFMNEKNFAYGVTLGESYLTRIEKTDRPNPLIIVSHLHAGARATNDSFNWDEGDFIDLNATGAGATMVSPAEAFAVKETVPSK